MGSICNSKTRPAVPTETKVETSAVNSLFATFGDDISKFIAAEKSKEFLNTKVI